MTDLSRAAGAGGVPLGAKVALAPVVGSPQTLDNGACADYTLTVGNLWDTGEFETALVNGDNRIHTFKVVRSRGNFGIRTDPSPAAIQGVAGALRVPLVNDDNTAYHVHWTLTIDGEPCKADGYELDLPARSTTPISCRLEDQGAGAFVLGGTLKDDAKKGLLAIDAVQRTTETIDAPRPRKEFAVAAAMSYWPEPWQSIANVGAFRLRCLPVE